MNFQNIRDDFNQHVLEQTQAIEAQQMRQHLAEELERQDKMHTKTRWAVRNAEVKGNCVQ